jgi:hypothetical protein
MKQNSKIITAFLMAVLQSALIFTGENNLYPNREDYDEDFKKFKQKAIESEFDPQSTKTPITLSGTTFQGLDDYSSQNYLDNDISVTKDSDYSPVYQEKEAFYLAMRISYDKTSFTKNDVEQYYTANSNYFDYWFKNVYNKNLKMSFIENSNNTTKNETPGHMSRTTKIVAIISVAAAAAGISYVAYHGRYYWNKFFGPSRDNNNQQ